MAVDETRYRLLHNSGLHHDIALILADPKKANASGGAVSAPAALTAPATISGTYTQAEVQKLRADVAALQSTLTTLVAALKSAGVVS